MPTGEELGSEPGLSTSVAALSCVCHVTAPQLGFCSGLNWGPQREMSTGRPLGPAHLASFGKKISANVAL